MPHPSKAFVFFFFLGCGSGFSIGEVRFASSWWKLSPFPSSDVSKVLPRCSLAAWPGAYGLIPRDVGQQSSENSHRVRNCDPGNWNVTGSPLWWRRCERRQFTALIAALSCGPSDSSNSPSLPDFQLLIAPVVRPWACPLGLPCKKKKLWSRFALVCRVWPSPRDDFMGL